MRSLLVATWFSVLCCMQGSNTLASDPEQLRLWNDAAPGAVGSEEKDIPGLIVYLPTSTAQKLSALVIFPGGGYGGLAMDHEGHQIARWANKLGMAGIICNYRHRGKGYGHPHPMLDAQRAIRIARHRADQWNLDPQKIGVIGFSAGGHLASTTLTHFDRGDESAQDPIERQSCRPDFGILCYPVIAFDQPYTHRGSQKNLLGENASRELIESLSNEKQVTPDTPPTFLWHTAEDKAVPAENSLRFYSALVDAKVPGELHVFPVGKHGLGLAAAAPGAQQWPSICQNWLAGLGIVPDLDAK